MKRIYLILKILFDIIFMLVFTPLVVLMGGIFQTWDEWKESIEYWKQEWSEMD